MLYVIYKKNHPELSYRGGQEAIVHLESDLRGTVAWAEEHGQRWAFTLSNAGARYFEDRCDLAELDEIDWGAVQATQWARLQEGKQAEFLIEGEFPWEQVRRIGIRSAQVYRQVTAALRNATHKPGVAIMDAWYYP